MMKRNTNYNLMIIKMIRLLFNYKIKLVNKVIRYIKINYLFKIYNNNMIKTTYHYKT